MLLNIRRQLGTTQATGASTSRPERAQGRGAGLALAGAKPSPDAPDTPAMQPRTPDPLNDVDWVTSGLRALGNGLGRKAAKESFTPPPAVKSSALPKPSPTDEKLADGSTVRRYRGVVY